MIEAGYTVVGVAWGSIGRARREPCGHEAESNEITYSALGRGTERDCDQAAPAESASASDLNQVDARDQAWGARAVVRSWRRYCRRVLVMRRPLRSSTTSSRRDTDPRTYSTSTSPSHDPLKRCVTLRPAFSALSRDLMLKKGTMGFYIQNMGVIEPMITDMTRIDDHSRSSKIRSSSAEQIGDGSCVCLASYTRTRPRPWRPIETGTRSVPTSTNHVSYRLPFVSVRHTNE